MLNNNRIRYIRRRISLIIAFICWSVATIGQDFSNKGRNFWIVYPDHVDGTNSAMGIYITSDVNATGTIRLGNRTIPFTVQANTVTRKFIGPNASGDAPNLGIVNTLSEGIQPNSGIQIVSDQPVVVYAHIINAARSGAMLALPVNVLGKEYIVPSYGSSGASGNNSGFGQVTVVGPEANTTIEIITVARNRNGNRNAGDTIRVTLPNPGDVYQIQFTKDADISGTKVRSIASSNGSCKPIAVFSSTTWSAFDCNSPSGGDNLLQQLFPVKAWGKTFLTSPFITKPYDIIRVFVNETNPRVFKTENGLRTRLIGLSSGGFYEIRSNEPMLIESETGPISVVQYMTSLSCDTRNPTNCYQTQSCPFPSDPEMVILNPVEQTINNITVFSARQNWVPAGQSNVNRCFLNIIIKTSEAGSFRINGNLPAGTFRTIPGTAYSYLQEDVSVLSQTNPVQNLRADSAFSAIAYGYGSVESYGYNAGTNVRDLSQFIQLENLLSTVNFPATCRNAPFGMSIVLSYQPTQIRWSAPDIPLDTTVLSPVSDSSWIQDGKTVYRYRLNKSLRVSQLGMIPVRVTTNNPTSDGCGNLQDIDYDLEVFERPKADFSFLSTGCFIDSVRFTDLTGQTGGRIINKWNWTFGANGTSGMQNPVVRFPGSANIQVGLSTVTDIGCVSDTANKLIALSAKPVARIDFSNPACERGEISISDASQVFGETISKWYWSINTSLDDSTLGAGPLTSVFQQAGRYPVSLAVRTTTGCLSEKVTRDLVVNPRPVANFIVPEVCVNDTEAKFIDSSYINGGNNSGFTYRWGFNIPAVISTMRDPVFNVLAIGTYPVGLVVTSVDGCRDTIVKTFTVNGAVPVAAFDIVTPSPICSNRDVNIRNNSSVDFGKITKLVIQWDALNNPNDTTLDEEPVPGKIYARRYPDFGSPAFKNYQIRVQAYSGVSCFNEVSKEIVVNASPQLLVDSLQPVCEEIPAFPVFSKARETSGMAGSFAFSGPGMNASGFFNPGNAGPGNHIIRYTFNASAGCAAFIETSMIVHPTPVVDAGPDRTVLEGSGILLNATATGNGLSFLWSPPLGMDDPTLLNPIASPIEDTRYLLTVTSANGCKAYDDVMILVLLKPIVPNTFTPNGDGYNDQWVIRHLEKYPGAIVEVFNTMGERLHRSVNYTTPWDGNWQGKPLPSGTYYYVIEPKNGRPKIAGYVTILR
jgi:gliding motility-associated-like protein